MFGRIVDNWRAHPGQQILGTLAGMFIPGGGQLAQLGFNAYNNHQFNNAAQQTNANTSLFGNNAAQQAFDQPLQGILGSFGGGNAGSYAGQSMMNNGGYNMSSMFGGGYSPSSSGLLDFLGSGVPQTPPGSFFQQPQQPDQGGGGGQGDHAGALGGGGGGHVTDFMVGGSPVITGFGDPMGRYVHNQRDYGG